MNDEGKLREQASRGERARQIVEQEIVQEAFAAIDKTLVEAWKGSAADEERARENAYLMYRLFQNFKAQFTVAIATGEAAKKELLSINDPSRIKRLINGRR